MSVWKTAATGEPTRYATTLSDWVEEQKKTIPGFDKLDTEVQEAQLAAWTARAPKSDAEEFEATVDTVKEITDYLKALDGFAKDAAEARKKLTLEVIAGWTAKDAKADGGTKTLADGTTKKLTAIEALREASGHLGWNTFIGWIATKNEGAKDKKLKETMASDWTLAEGVKPEIIALILEDAKAKS